ncbi:MAG: HU family DNA-binding protein [Loktanella sp.]|nr:HU family DNA-binding protein [Loktanella sp.]
MDTSNPTQIETETAAFKKPDLLEQITARTTLKKRDAKAAVDAALAIIGEAIARGDDIILPPLGKIRVIKTKDVGDGAQAVTLKLRTAKEATEIAPSGLATADEDD